MENLQDDKATLRPFTLDDAQEDDKACLVCELRDNCSIIVYINKLRQKRDGKLADDEFSCVFFKEETEELHN